MRRFRRQIILELEVSPTIYATVDVHFLCTVFSKRYGTFSVNARGERTLFSSNKVVRRRANAKRAHGVYSGTRVSLG